MRLAAIFLNLFVPGAGFVFLGFYRYALFLQLILVLSLLLLCWSRFVFEPTYIFSFIVTLTFCYLFSFISCFWLTNKTTKIIKQSLYTFIFMALGITFVTTSFIFKEHLLGIHIYFVPSASMYPTLMPGQFILLDTWIYTRQKPQLDDIVVFNLKTETQLMSLVKRVSYWPDGQLKHLNKWFLLGDNTHNSRDSRFFGGIKSEQIIGQVKLILAEVDQSHQLVHNSFLKIIK